jgi:hypothetical protein
VSSKTGIGAAGGGETEATAVTDKPPLYVPLRGKGLCCVVVSVSGNLWKYAVKIGKKL